MYYCPKELSFLHAFIVSLGDQLPIASTHIYHEIEVIFMSF